MELEEANWYDGKGFQGKIQLEGCVDAVLGHQQARQCTEDAPAQGGKHALLTIVTILHQSASERTIRGLEISDCIGLLVLCLSKHYVPPEEGEATERDGKVLLPTDTQSGDENAEQFCDEQWSCNALVKEFSWQQLAYRLCC